MLDTYSIFNKKIVAFKHVDISKFIIVLDDQQEIIFEAEVAYSSDVIIPCLNIKTNICVSP